MSEARSLVNMIGNAVATVVMAAWEGELDRDRLRLALDGQLPPAEHEHRVGASRWQGPGAEPLPVREGTGLF